MSRKNTEAPTVMCPYCLGRAVLADSAEVYRGTSYGFIWICRPCQAYVGTHKLSAVHFPLGRLANAELRAIKIKAHAAFDPRWRYRKTHGSRKDAYKWLAEQLGIPVKECHIGWFDVADCKRVIEVCTANPPCPPPYYEVRL
jgi:hypothetical protein